MSWSREEALTDPAIQKPLIFVSEFTFSLKDIPVEITMRLYRPIHSGKMIVRQSHFISVDGVDDQLKANCENDDREGEVLHAAVDEMVCLYNAAKSKGLTPDASWVKPNADFK